jgi:hypothetical protein
MTDLENEIEAAGRMVPPDVTLQHFLHGHTDPEKHMAIGRAFLRAWDELLRDPKAEGELEEIYALMLGRDLTAEESELVAEYKSDPA